MLGVGSGAGRSGKIRRIVKDGLQAWYKADVTQAPLGEEQIVNGNFSSLGPELVTNGSFIGVADGTDSILVDGAAEGWRAYGDAISRNIVNEQLVIVTDASGNDGVRYDVSGATAGEVYKIQLDVLQGAGGSSVYSSNPNETLIVSGATAENPTKTFYKTIQGDGAFSVYFRGPNNVAGTAIYDNISIKKVNPNDSWNTNTGVGSWTFKDGFAEFDKSDGTTYIGINSLLVANTKYRLSFKVEGTGPNLAIYRGNSDALVSYANYSTGTHEVEFTVGGVGGDFRIFGHGINSSDFTITNISLRKVVNSVKDFSPNSNDAVLYSGTCLDFDGDASNPDYVTLDYPAAGTVIDSNSKYTIACWFNAATLGGKMIFGTNQDGAGNNRLYLWTDSSKLFFNWGDQSGSVTTGSAPDVVADRWYRVVVVLNGLTAYVYLDGELQYTRTSGAFNPSDLANNLTIGRDGNDDNYEYDGMVSDFQVYDACWAASDVTYDYNNPDKDVFDNSTSSILPTNCKTLLRLNEGAGTRLYDAAPVLGAELVANDNFATDLSSWTASHNTSTHNVTYSNGSARYQSSSTSPQFNFDQTISDVVVGRTYQLSIDVTNTTGSLKTASIDANQTVLTEGLNTFNIVASTKTIRILRAEATVDVLINSVSLREITLSDSFIYVDGDNDTAEWKTVQPYIPQLAMSSYSKKIVFTDIDTDVDVGAQSIADDQAFSFSFWYAQTDDSSLENYILAKHDSTDDYIRFNNQNQSLEFKVNGGTAITYNIGDLTDFKISHIALTRASGANPITKCYVNGILEITDTSNNADGVFEYQQIGAGGTSNAGTFFLDELAHFDKELSLTEVQEIFNAGTALDCRDHSAASDLEGYWRNNGTDQWDDLSTNSNNGTVNGSPTTIQLQEVPYFKKDSLGLPMNRVREGGLNLTGNGYLKIDNSSDFNFSNVGFTIQAWVKPFSLTTNDRIITKGKTGSGDWMISIGDDGASVRVYAKDSGGNVLDSANEFSTLSLNTWSMITVVVDTPNDQILFYKDNQETATQKTGASWSGNFYGDDPLIIGANKDFDVDRFNGIVDDVKIYNKVLTAAEKTKNYKKGLATHK